MYVDIYNLVAPGNATRLDCWRRPLGAAETPELCDSVRVFTQWGLLFLAVPLVILTVRGLALLTMPRAGFDSLLAGATLTVALVAVGVRFLGWVGMLRTPVLIGALAALAVVVTVTAQLRGHRWRIPWRRTVSWATSPLIVAVAVTLAIVVAAAYYLPVWQYDALGYHLPYVNFALQHGTFSDIPGGVRYLASYPHIVEYTYIGWRAMLPDDRLVDLAQLPLGLMGSLALATVASRLGARQDHALAAGAAWLTLPAVFLQLPTNYVDVASAALLLTAIAFILGPPEPRRIMLAGLAIGLFLGSKPTALPAVVLLLVALAISAHRGGRLNWVGPAAVLTIVIGGETYIANVVRHGNPVWPVRFDVGPLHLPGPVSASDLLTSGAAAPHTEGNLLVRILHSWPVIDPPLPVFDMRIGGLGLLFVVALVTAVVCWLRTPSLLLALVAAATLATPDPAVARYVLGFAGLMLAMAVPAMTRLPARRAWPAVIFGLAAVVAAHNVVISYPGLTGEGPALTAYVHMTDDQRRRAVGADGSPSPFLDALTHVGPGEITVFDQSADLPYLAWPFDLSRAAERIPDDVTVDEAERIIESTSVRLLIVGDDTVTGNLARRQPDRFIPQFHCKSAPCTVYLKRWMPT